ncbi:MAG: HEAT repeat domain-containing protein [Rhodospirillales bacterium]|nr:HEAT repeat domain-containing protein [Rhodospirillales bacterium]MCW8862169.1 HEAT repeat domain-containing protein [Rhodospirillales bacterium]MCW8952303.1 HEAT repeat domain-containing protein [Rhodospirillales bacterium]
MSSKRLGRYFLVFPGEGALVLYSASLYFLLGLGMALGRASSDTLFFKRFGVEFLPHMFFATGILLVLFGLFYAELADRVRSHRLFQGMLLLYVVFLGFTWTFISTDSHPLWYVVYFLGYAVFSEFVVTHFNLYVSGFMDPLQSKRLFPLITAGSRMGGIIGGAMMAVMLSWLNTEDMALVWAASLSISIILLAAYHRGEQRPTKRKAKSTHSATASRGRFTAISEGLRYARRSAFVRVTGYAMFALIVIIAIQDYLVSTIITGHFTDEAQLAAFFGWFTAITNAVTLFLQLLVTNRMMRRFGLKFVSLIYPVTSLLTFAALAVSPSFLAALVGRFNYMGFLPAFRHPSANLYFHALPLQVQGRVRALMTGLVLPLGMGFAGLMLIAVDKEAVIQWLGWVGFAAAGAYLLFQVWKNRLYGTSLVQLIQGQVFVSKGGTIEDLRRLDRAVCARLEQLIREAKDTDSLMTFVDLLWRGAPEDAGPILLDIAPTKEPAIRDRLLRILANLRSPGWEGFAHTCQNDGDPHLRGTALTLLAEHGDDRVWAVTEEWLRHDSPRFRATAAHIAMGSGHPGTMEGGRETLERMLASNLSSDLMAALSVVRLMRDPSWYDRVAPLTTHENRRVHAAAVYCLGAIGEPGKGIMAGILQKAFDDPVWEVRKAAIASAPGHLPLDARLALLSRALRDESFQVKKAAADTAPLLMPMTLEDYRTSLSGFADDFRILALLCDGLTAAKFDGADTLLRETVHNQLDAAERKRRIALAVKAMNPEEASIAVSQESFLSTVLHEEVHRHLGLALHALDVMGEHDVVRAGRAAWASREKSTRALALETMLSGQQDPLIRRLATVLQNEHDETWRSGEAVPVASWEETLIWCATHGSRWLKRCAQSLNTRIETAPTGERPAVW